MAFPKIEVCIVCEGVREELLRKHILLGFFGICPHLSIGVKDFRLPLSLSFVFCGGEGEGKFNLQLRVSDASGVTIPNTLVNTIDGVLKKGIPNTTVFFAFQGIFTKPGEFRVSLIVENVEHYSTTLRLTPFEQTGINIAVN